jgi:predicted RecA/RadA family phage recombinase
MWLPSEERVYLAHTEKILCCGPPGNPEVALTVVHEVTRRRTRSHSCDGANVASAQSLETSGSRRELGSLEQAFVDRLVSPLSDEIDAVQDGVFELPASARADAGARVFRTMKTTSTTRRGSATRGSMARPSVGSTKATAVSNM